MGRRVVPAEVTTPVRRTLTPMSRLRRLSIVALTACVATVGASCTRSEEIPPYADEGLVRETTTIDPLDGAELASGAAGVEELRALFDRLLASKDACAILTQRDLEENRLDPTLFTNAEARRVLADGLVKVYDHLIAISPSQVTPALQAQKDVFSQVLGVVDRYAANPNNPGATAEIETLVNAEGFIVAGQQISQYVATACF